MLNDQPMAVFDFWKSAEIVDDLTFPFFSSQDLLLQISSSLERLYKFPTVQSQTQSPGYGDLGSQKNLMGSCGERITPRCKIPSSLGIISGFPGNATMLYPLI
jgi:hypothetical protein